MNVLDRPAARCDDAAGAEPCCRRCGRALLRYDFERVDPDAARSAHLAAADWLSAHDRPIASIDHLLASHEHQRAHEVVMDFFCPACICAHRQDIDRWLTALPTR